jgi:hypothetical protein
MKNVEEELTSIGFGTNRWEPPAWRAERLDGPAFSARALHAKPEPASSRTLMRWRELLAQSPVASPYRIFRAEG